MPTGPLSSSKAKQNASSWVKSWHVRRVAVLAAFSFLVFIYVVVPHLQVPGITRLTPDREPVTGSTSRVKDISNSNPRRIARPRAAFVVLVRDRQLGELLPSIRDIQWAFNDDPEHCYSYVRRFLAFCSSSSIWNEIADLDLPSAVDRKRSFSRKRPSPTGSRIAWMTFSRAGHADQRPPMD